MRPLIPRLTSYSNIPARALLEAWYSVFTSFAVKRIAEVRLVDFDNNFNFVTFKNQFANLLRRYRDSGFDIAVAEEIFDKYRMFVVERGLFGGYKQLRSTATSDDFDQFLS